jgi:type II secretory pathway pseudopilin PulG
LKHWDRRGLEGLPLKLMIVALIVSVSAPAVLGSLESFERSTARTLLLSEAERLAAAAEEVFNSGEGNRRMISVDVPGNENGLDMSLEAGGDPDSTASLSIRCLTSGQVTSTVIMDHPTVRMTGPGGGPVTLGSGTHDLSLECQEVDGRTIVIVEEST